MITYFDLKEDYILEKNDELLIHGIKHLVHQHVGFYLRADNVFNNAKIFDLFGLSCEEKNDWANKFGALTNGREPKAFPEMPTLEALTKFVIDIYERSPYKVGDEVRIVKCEADSNKYPAGFTSGMREMSGKIYKIKSSRLCKDGSIASRAKYNGDPHWYKLQENIFTWSSAHFTRATEEEIHAEEKRKAKSAPSYKVGDEVFILPREGGDSDYPFDYVDEMVEFAGSKAVIKSKSDFDMTFGNYNKRKFYNDDDHYYILEGPDGIDDWCWHSSVFEKVEVEEEKISGPEVESTEIDHAHVRYQNLKDGYILETGDMLLLKGLLCHVASNGKRFWLSNGSLDENKIFNKLGINDIKGFASKYGECHIVGEQSFPEMESAEELTNLVIALYEYKPGMESTKYLKFKEESYDRYIKCIDMALREPYPLPEEWSLEESQETGIRLPKKSGNYNIQL